MQFRIELPPGMIEKLEAISSESGIFEGPHDVIIHAITDMLQEYGK